MTSNQLIDAMFARRGYPMEERMTREKATALLSEMNRSTVAVVHSVNSRRGLTKKAATEEYQAANAIFEALTGEKLTVEQWNEIAG